MEIKPVTLIRKLGKIFSYYNWIKTHPKDVERYRQGRVFEYATMKRLRSLGFYCIRKFGSIGAEDVVAVRGGRVLFCQCKHSKVQTTAPHMFDLERLKALAKTYDAECLFAGVHNRKLYFMVWKNGKWQEWTK